MILKVSRIVIPLIILVTSTAGFLIMMAKPEEERRPLDEGRPTGVLVSRVEEHPGTLDIHVDGLVVPYREIDLSAEVAGRITFKAYEARAGRFVREGEVLFAIDDHDYRVEVHRLENQVKQAGESIKELEAEIQGVSELAILGAIQVELAENEYKRQLELHSSEVSTDSERDKARQAEVTARNALTMVENQKRVFEAKRERLRQAKELFSLQLKKADYDHARTIIQAPVDGVIVSDAVERDDFVNVGTPLVIIEDTSAVEVRCSLRMDELYWIWDQVGAPAADEDQVSSGGDYQIRPTPATVSYRLQGRDYFWTGELWRIDGIGLDERTRTVPCRVIVRKPREVWVMEDGQPQKPRGGPPALVRGMYVDVAIQTTPKSQFFVVPETAVRPADKHDKIWIARPGKDAQPVDDGNWFSGPHNLKAVNVDIVANVEGFDNNKIAIVHAVGNDLAEGDQVVEEPLGMEREKMAVTLKARIAIGTIAGDDVINTTEDDNVVTISGTTRYVEDGQTVTVTLNDQDYTGNVSASTWSVSVPAVNLQALPKGSHKVSASVSNVVGNAANASRRVEHDTSATADEAEPEK